MANATIMAASSFRSVQSSSPLAQQLPQLTQETEMQKMLTDERMRSEQHKTNFQQLRAEHKRLQEDYAQLQSDIKVTIEESRIVQEKYNSRYNQARKELAECQSEMEDLRSKALTPQRLEMIKLQVLEEIEKSYKEKFQQQEKELDEARINRSQAKYELSFLKSEYEHDKKEHRCFLEEIQLQHEAEVTNLRKERETTINRIQSESSQDTYKCRVLQRENARLHLKIKGLLSELEELRAEKDKVGFESDSVSRIQSKQLKEYAANIKSMEIERESLRHQVEHLSQDIVSTGIEHNKLANLMHELEKENTILKSRVEELMHKGRINMTELRMEMLKERGDLERERDKLMITVEDLQTQLELKDQKIGQISLALEKCEQETVKRVQAALKEEFSKFSKLETEKFELETKLQELARRKIDEDAHRHAEQEHMEEQIKTAYVEKDKAQKELLVQQTRMYQIESLEEQIQRERTENNELKSRNSCLEEKLCDCLNSEQEMTDRNIKLHNQVELLQEELKLTRDQLVKIQDSNSCIISQQRSALMEEKLQLEQRLHELEDQVNVVHSKLSKTVSFHKKYKKRCHKVTDNLKDKLMILHAKIQELELEKTALQKCVPQDTFNQLKKQFRDLFRRHQEFRAILLSGVHEFPVAQKPLTDLLCDGTCDTEQQHQEDLHLLRKQLDQLGKVQNQQLEELQDAAHSTVLEKSALSVSCFKDSQTESSVNYKEKRDEEKDFSSL